MDIYAPIARHVMIPLQARRYGARWPWYMSEIAEWERLSQSAIRERQWTKLTALLSHAYENVPYYRRVFEVQGLKPKDICDFDAFCRLPVLSKQNIKEHGNDLVAQNLPSDQIVATFTGGTTGIPMQFKRDIRCRDLHYAATTYFAQWYGYQPGDPQAMIWGARQDLPSAISLRTKFVNTVCRGPLILQGGALTEEAMAEYAKKLRRLKPKRLRGYTSAIAYFADYVSSTGTTLPIPAVVCTAEPLFPSFRDKIEKAFCAEVFDEYSGRELGFMAMECRAHQGLHINASSLYLEVLDEHGKPIPYGKPGTLVGTDLDSYGMPFIRYDLGDMGTMTDRICRCGIQLPLLASLEGRIIDVLLGSNGKAVSGGTFVYITASKNIPAQLQFIQAEDRTITVNLVPEPSFSNNHETMLRQMIAEMLGEEIEVTIQMVSNIPLAPSGKFIYSMSYAHKMAREKKEIPDRGGGYQLKN